MHLRRILGLAMGPLALAAAAPGLSQDVLMVRAITPLSEPFVRAVARYAEPQALPAAASEIVKNQTAAQVITSKCGSLQPGYYDEFLKLNAETLGRNNAAAFPHDRPLGDLAGQLKLPECLLVRPGAGVPASTSHGQAAPLSLQQAPVSQLTPRSGESAEDLSRHLSESIAQPQGIDEASWGPPRPPAEGRIIAPLEVPAGEGVAATAATTCPASHPPFDAQQVAAYYSFVRVEAKNRHLVNPVVPVWVFDNGFYGVDPAAAAPFPVAFPAALFADWSTAPGVVGPIFPSGTGKMTPWLDRNVIKPTLLSSHGTHVTGLVLGGSGFITYRSIFAQDDKPSESWLRLSLINLANGDRKLRPDSIGSLRMLLTLNSERPSGRIVNLSIAYLEGTDSPDNATKSAFSDILRTYSNDLFVAAAGNDSDDAGDLGVFPAALGGLRADNLITVGAHDDQTPTRLTGFSNRGQSVDIAAPGCSVKSWTDMNTEDTMSGTSQAAPLVAFTATLMKSLNSSLMPRDLKYRILASADLFDSDPSPNVNPRLKLNIAKALLFFFDYVETSTGEVFIGKIEDIKGLRCQGDSGYSRWGRDPRKIVSYKTLGPVAKLVASNYAAPSCDAAIDPPAPGKNTYLKLRPIYHLNGASIVQLPPSAPKDIPLSEIREIVRMIPMPGQS
ncbi:S8 family serine peptidase [Sphingomonas sp. BK235]|uniref:S8 family serine peptidase n=1 Tax=Sphingomonas sp. BK235 TaxID=2512131 RepID=UPI0010456C24|nr:S8 family serine peptidase [Sphingomonas sp. BK235]TCP30114.1 subtilase family protein [Sphingomonas sp. BK235]